MLESKNWVEMGQRDRFLFYLASSVLEYRQNNYVKAEKFAYLAKVINFSCFLWWYSGFQVKKGCREAGFSVASGNGISCFYRVGFEIGKGNRAGYGISIPAWLHHKLTNTKPEAGESFAIVRFAVSERLCTLSGPAKCIHYHLLFISIRLYEVFRCYCDLLSWPLT